MSIQLLLGDTPKTQFAAEYLHRLPFSLPGGGKALCHLGTWETLGDILAGEQPDVMVVRQGEQLAAQPNSRGDAEKLAAGGCTILVRNAQRHNGGIAELAAGFARDFGAPVNVHVYATPGHAFGFSWHYDAEEVFIVQTSGQKEYSLRKNTVNPWPTVETIPRDMQYEREIMPLMRVSLSAGDWLYIPSGYWHKAETKSDEVAISLAIGVMPRTGIDLLDALRQHLLNSLLWRQRLPLTGDASPLSQEELQTQYRELLVTLADDLRQHFASDRFVAACLNEHEAIEQKIAKTAKE